MTFRLKTYIPSLKTCISKLEMYISRLEIKNPNRTSGVLYSENPLQKVRIFRRIHYLCSLFYSKKRKIQPKKWDYSFEKA